ncbi:MAG: hypothetical protein SNJ70_05610 [Armatimonadota bacterium]
MLEDDQIIKRLIWDAFKEQANGITNLLDEKNYFHIGLNHEDKSIADIVMKKLNTNDISFKNNNKYRFLLLEAFYNAQNLGLIIPGKLSQPLGWSQEYGVYYFTQKGIDFLKNGEIPITSHSILHERLWEVIEKYNVNKAILSIVDEAHKCWSLGCLRASVVLIGLASEESISTLLNQIKKYPHPPTNGHNLKNWNDIKDNNKSFFATWNSGKELLLYIKDNLSRMYRNDKPEWWSIWEIFPESISPYANAVRIARNTAAHTIDDIFTPAQIGLLLCHIPNLIEIVFNINAFLENPPNNISLPEL